MKRLILSSAFALAVAYGLAASASEHPFAKAGCGGNGCGSAVTGNVLAKN
ncbi:MAG: hypothetical protein HYZ28_03040, partial [Myxococcales bacterium]|nr:hypothetical protein [Myxococcales bacterium]